MSRDASSLLPLTPAVFHVLLAIAEADTHGYAILKDVARRTEGRVVLSTGTLYGIVKRLLADGLIEESRRRPPAAEDDERRRYYHLTAFGRAVAAAEADRLAQMIATARTRRLIPGRGQA